MNDRNRNTAEEDYYEQQERISYGTSPTTDINISPQKIEILYDSDNVLAIHKPPHIPHHNEIDILTNTTTLGIINHIRYLQQLGETDNDHSPSSFPYKGRIYGIHRLDKVTSGILLLAKNPQAAQCLTEAFRVSSSLSNSSSNKEDIVTKYYIALSNKKPKKKKQGWVRGIMTRSRRKSWKLATSNNNKGKKGDVPVDSSSKNTAVTRFYTAGLGSIPNNKKTHDTPKTLILFRPHTGKTHQLRVAGKSVGLPISGDDLYGDTKEASLVPRAYLHAAAIHIDLTKCRNWEEGLMEGNITIWCPPSSSWFDQFWEGSDTNYSNGLNDIILTMMDKYCDSDRLRKLILNYN